MIDLYEESIISDWRDKLGDSRVSILSPETLFEHIADLESDKITLPAVSLKRLGYSFREPPRANPNSLDGTKVSYQMTPDGPVFHKRVQMIPIQCRWQVDTFSRSRKDNDNLTRELLFYYINNPSLDVIVPYGLNKSHRFSLSIDEDIEDNSDIESHKVKGEIYRSTFIITCKDAYMWKVTNGAGKTLDITYEGYHKDILEEKDNLKTDD